MKKKISSNGSLSPSVLTFEMAQKKAANAIISQWAVMTMVRRRADSDESPDPLEAIHESIENNIAAEISGCRDCFYSTRSCGSCEHDTANTEH